ncbi:MAG TPA: dihydrolipoamide acetyltransferase family protein [Ktedonobacteraceae bacterium]|jgi:pyruvate/2-oxoglutarate dehydrogenase complex dihydrolipoamide acyltransferase (E2) component|nr:dihydrolipoamide acetyltransferase family protein [Ktedonobacteraceae bacterium]
MATPVKMPRLGESVAEGTVANWLKKEGDWVERDESLAEIITDKINAELPSPVAGRLTKILVKADETVPVGVDIALIEENADVTASPPAEAAPGPDAAPVETPNQATIPVIEQRTVAPAGGNGASAVPQQARPERIGEEERQRISPLARRLAREHDIDLNAIAGTGIGGRVRRDDILAYIAARSQREPVTAAAAVTQAAAPARPAPPTPPPPAVPSAPSMKPEPAPAAPPAPTVAGEDEEVVTPSRMRLAIAEHMVRSKRTSPHATTVVEVDMTNIAKWLEKHKDEFKKREGYGISFVPFVMKAVCEGIRQVPLMNSSWTEDNKIIIKKRINLGIAVATDLGLVVPTIHDADQYTIAGLAKQVAAVAQRARANKLTIQDMQGSTFVVNNPGTFGTIISVPIINQPHAGILSMDAVVKRPVVIEDDAIAVRSMMYLCLSFDHRILDGAGAASFLQAVRTKLQSYGREIDVY